MDHYSTSLSTPAIPNPPSQARRQPQPAQSTPWTAEEDRTLLEAKSQGLGWDQIAEQNFPNRKSGNACRKRHERLMVKRRTTDWDEARIQKLAEHYNSSGFRERFWRQLADEVQERWDDVERVCFQQGLRGLKSTRSKHTRNISRASSGHGPLDYEHHSSHDEYDQEDSGIGLDVSQGRHHGYPESNNHHLLPPPREHYLYR